ncbi:MAG: chloride channel protein [Bacteroidales bacterium]|nr:chloride channel protein [Bacteroidales bacterium]
MQARFNSSHTVTDLSRSWRHRNVSETTVTFVAAVLIGLACGLGAFLVKRTIRYISLFAVSGMRTDGSNWRFLVLPLIGITLAYLYTRYVARRPLAHGTEQVRGVLASQSYRMPVALTYQPLLANALTLGFGSSAGAEGPIAFAGAAMGSGFARLFNLSPATMRILVGVGAGAGIAAIFKAPVGGMLFTLEVLAMELTTLSVFVLITAGLVAGLTSFALLGMDFSFAYTTRSDFFDTHWVIPVLALGIFCGFYSLYYSGTAGAMKKWMQSRRNPWVAVITSGLFASVLLFVFPSLYGEGYPSMVRIFHNDPMAIVDNGPFYGLITGPWSIILIAGGIALVKGAVTAAVNNGGGVAGKFAPTLFAGCMVGLFFAGIANFIPGVQLAVPSYAFIAMAGIMAGTIRAPFMAIFLTSEMSGDFGLFLPSVVVAFISYGIVVFFTRKKSK